MNTADVMKPLLAFLEPYYEDTAPGACAYIAGAVVLDVSKGKRPKELHSYRVIDVHISIDGKTDITLNGTTTPLPKADTGGATTAFAKSARGLWMPKDGEVLEAFLAPKHAVVLCKMTDGTFAILDGNEGQFAHLDGDLTFHVLVDDLGMKGANMNAPEITGRGE